MRTWLTGASLCLVLMAGGCASAPTPEPDIGAAFHAPSGTGTDGVPGAAASAPVDDSLFRALGGHAGIESLGELFIRELAADETTRAFFKRTNITRFHRLMQEQLCEESGGGCTYTGEDMRTAHAGLNIQRSDMNAVVEALMRAMDKQGLPIAIQNAVLALHAPKRRDVLGE